jgi:hypothetical protein
VQITPLEPLKYVVFFKQITANHLQIKQQKTHPNLESDLQ